MVEWGGCGCGCGGGGGGGGPHGVFIGIAYTDPLILKSL